jgi:hypothetical protein
VDDGKSGSRMTRSRGGTAEDEAGGQSEGNNGGGGGSGQEGGEPSGGNNTIMLATSSRRQQQQQQDNEYHIKKRKLRGQVEGDNSGGAGGGGNNSSGGGGGGGSGSNGCGGGGGMSNSNNTNGLTNRPSGEPLTDIEKHRNIRRQIELRRKNLFPVQPKPPEGFRDYLMNKKTYHLQGNIGKDSRIQPIPKIAPPPSLEGPFRDLFLSQENERYKLRMKHLVEKEKLVLAVEQVSRQCCGSGSSSTRNGSGSFYNHAKIVPKKHINFYCFVTSLFLSFEKFM